MVSNILAQACIMPWVALHTVKDLFNATHRKPCFSFYNLYNNKSLPKYRMPKNVK